MTDNQRKWYEGKRDAFINGTGQRWDLVSGMTYAAVCCGLSTEEVINECQARMPDFSREHANNIRRGVQSAQIKTNARTENYRESFKRSPEPGFPNYVKDLISSGGGNASMDELRELSPIRMFGYEPGMQTEMFLRALWNPSDLLHMENSQCHERAVMGLQLNRTDTWCGILEMRRVPYDIIGRNPYSGIPGENSLGKPSLTTAGCVTKFRYALIEFDNLPLNQQCAFWKGFLKLPKLSNRLRSLVYSGSKSIHGLILVNEDRNSTTQVERNLRRLFSADTDKTYQADVNGFRLRGGTRLAGATRAENGIVQELLFLRPPTE